MPRFSTPK